MTRTTNAQILSNNARYTYANTTRARVLVSVDMNGSSNADTDYTTTLYGKTLRAIQKAALSTRRRSRKGGVPARRST
jgi:N-acetylmuramoyl-L-alanine amidase